MFVSRGCFSTDTQVKMEKGNNKKKKRAIIRIFIATTCLAH